MSYGRMKAAEPKLAAEIEAWFAQADAGIGSAGALEVGWSRKHMANRVHDLLGVGPRSYRRVLRFGRVVVTAGGADTPIWAHPGRSYNVRDPEGNNWDFGSYDPWAE